MRDAADVALGVGVAGTALAATAARPFVTAALGTLRLGARISHGRSSAGLARLAYRGGHLREALERATAEVVRWILPLALESALAAIDLTDLILAHVDLDALAKALDVDAVVARVDIDAAVARVDLDGVAARLDLNAIIDRADLDRAVSGVDLNAIIDRADLDRAVSRVDLNAIIDRADLDRAVSGVDLNAIIDRADLDRAVSRVDLDEIVARVDIEAALGRLDLAGIARQVIEAIHLPEILRESSGVVSSQAVHVVRTQGMNADESVSRFFDRMLHRPHAGRAETP
jgi:hypothetical protein